MQLQCRSWPSVIKNGSKSRMCLSSTQCRLMRRPSSRTLQVLHFRLYACLFSIPTRTRRSWSKTSHTCTSTTMTWFTARTMGPQSSTNRHCQNYMSAHGPSARVQSEVWLRLSLTKMQPRTTSCAQPRKNRRVWLWNSNANTLILSSGTPRSNLCRFSKVLEDSSHLWNNLRTTNLRSKQESVHKVRVAEAIQANKVSKSRRFLRVWCTWSLSSYSSTSNLLKLCLLTLRLKSK